MSFKKIAINIFIFLIYVSCLNSKPLFLNPYPKNYNFIRVQDAGFYTSCLLLYYNGKLTENYFLVSSVHDTGYLTKNVFVTVNGEYSIANINFPFLQIKKNVFPYLQKDFAVKLLFLLNKMKFLPRISDAMRSENDQLKYKRRGWSNKEISPHLTGLAVDLSYFTRYDREIIKKYNEQLGIKILEHGGRKNHHLHLQDQIRWSSLNLNQVMQISKGTFSQLNSVDYADYSTFPTTEKGNDFDSLYNDLNFSFIAQQPEILRIEIYTPIGEKKAEITSGVFEPGSHSVSLNFTYLKGRIFIIKIFRNGLFEKEIMYVKD